MAKFSVINSLSAVIPTVFAMIMASVASSVKWVRSGAAASSGRTAISPAEADGAAVLMGSGPSVQAAIATTAAIL